MTIKQLHLALAFLALWAPNELFTQVNVDFSASRLSGCGSFQVNFTDRSSSTVGNIVSWQWDLGGVIASSQNPGRVFGSPGEYDICLTVTDVAGNNATECKSAYIVVYHLPEPDFIVNTAEGCSPMHVIFSDASMAQDAPIVEWVWGLGGSTGVITDDGSLSVIESSYTIPDQYTISLTVRDTNGCINTLTETDFLTLHEDPIIDISADTRFKCLPPLTVDFTNNNPEGNVTYHWDFGNGITFTGPQPPPVEYTQNGLYTIQVIAESSATGCTDTLIQEDYIEVGRPGQITASAATACVGEAIDLMDVADVTADSVLWDFGDGESSMLSNPSYAYQNAGCYTIRLTRWVNGCENTTTLQQCVLIHPLPAINYISNNTLGCSLPHNANFFGVSADAVAWEWNFGDGGQSDSRNPSHEYTAYGEYPVSLTAINALGCRSTITIDTVRVQPTEARVGGDRFFGCTPLAINLMDQSNSVAPIVSWDWRISTPTIPSSVFSSNDQNPSFTLVDTGRYDIRLIVQNNLGCRDTSFTRGLIGVGMPPITNFNANPAITCIENSITFTDMSSSFSDEWLWDFGDGTDSNEQFPVHEYQDTGFFEVILTTYHLGCRNQQIFSSLINVEPPRAGFSITRDCDRPYDVDLGDGSIGADHIFWDFGVDGVLDDTSNARVLTFSYPDTGAYTITLIAYNDTTGCQDTTFSEVIITDPKADFSLSTTQGCAPLQIDMINQSESAAQFSWTAAGGDWSDAAAAEPSLTFAAGGTYSDIKLLVTDINGCQDSMVFTDPIRANAAMADFSLTPGGGCEPLDVQLTDQSSDLFGNIVDWNWTIGNGVFQSSDQNPSIHLPDAGFYDVELIVRDDWGCEGRSTIQNAIEVTFPIADFTADTFGCTQREVVFVNTSQGDSLSYFWDFGDGTNSAARAPQHFYVLEGTYSVCLTVSNKYGCDSTFCRPDYITIADPVANFSIDNAYATCPPLLANFENLSQNANTYIWDFGDASGTSTLENPPHVYTVPGLYDVSLIAIANDRCQDTLVMSDLIQLDGPIGSFSFDIDSSCVPVQITFKGQSVEDYDYVWDFGNGILDSTQQVSSDSLVFTYTEAGKYVPKLILINDENCHRTLESPDTIYLATLKADFATDTPILCGPSEARFLNISNSTESIISYSWTFPGTTQGSSLSAEPLIQFDTTGQYDVQLLIDNGFCKDSIYKRSVIEVGAIPEVDFSLSDSVACMPQQIDLSDQSQIEKNRLVAWEWQFGDGNTSSDQNTSYEYTEDGVFEIQLKVQSDLNCVDSSSQKLRIWPRPGAAVGDYPEICIGEALQVNASITSDSSSFVWMDHPGLSCTNCLDPIVNVPVTTTFHLITENNHACRDTSALTVEVGPYAVPSITLSEDTTICLNDPVQLFVGGGFDINSYQWDASDIGLSCYASCNNPIASPVASTTYHVTVTNEYGCQSQDSVRVDVLDQFQSFTSPDRTICRGDTVQLGLNTGNNPVWLTTTGLDCTYCPNPIASPLETTTYRVRVTTDNGCDIFDSVTLTVVDPEGIDAGADTLVCLGEAVQLRGQGRGQVNWSPAGSLDNENVLNPEALPSQSTQYYLSTLEGECELMDSVWVEVIEQATVITSDTTICEGETVELEASGQADSFDWLASPYLSATNIANPMASPPSTTQFNVVGTLTGCEPDTGAFTVTVIPAPEVDLPPLYRFFAGQTVRLKAEPVDSNTFHYQWIDPLGFTCSSCPRPAVKPDSTSNYQLVVSDPATGCLDTLSTTVQMMQTCPEDLISIPNIFTPNDDGENDELALYPSTALTSISSFRIFNRWGALVFETDDIYDTWDGTVKGKLAPQGVYIYLLEAPCEVIDGQLMKTGDITLLR